MPLQFIVKVLVVLLLMLAIFAASKWNEERKYAKAVRARSAAQRDFDRQRKLEDANFEARLERGEIPKCVDCRHYRSFGQCGVLKPTTDKLTGLVIDAPSVYCSNERHDRFGDIGCGREGLKFEPRVK